MKIKASTDSISYYTILVFILLITSFESKAQKLKSLDYTDINISGELSIRTLKNYDRLETDIYTPAKVFPLRDAGENVEWPGDMEGRIILGLVLQAQATHREPKYLAEMFRIIPDRVNSKGYFGPVQKDTILEQQLSGNGWYLRALCEYYIWKKDPKIKEYIKAIINNLVLRTRGYHKNYPLDPASRKKHAGAASGTTLATVGKWKLSSDVGCDFIFMDGVVQAYEILPSVELKDLIDEMIARFLEMDLKAINAQTHATLTGVRALLRYYKINKQPLLLKEAKKRYDLYRLSAMTANFENFNWFGRPEWTEPCAIIDSYMVAVQLWQFTNQPVYLEDAHHIYFNAIANTQRTNGGFGLSNCPIPGHNSLNVNNDEAWWCCTMRGGEGLAIAVRNNYFYSDNELVVPFYNNSEAKFNIGKKRFVIKQTTEYPFKGIVAFEVEDSFSQSLFTVKLVAPSWTKKYKLLINGLPVSFMVSNGFLVFKTKFSKGDRISLTFDMDTMISHMVNNEYSKQEYYTISYGPLLLGYDTNKNQEILFNKFPALIRLGELEWGVKGKNIHLTPVYHLLSPYVNKEAGYSKQILFKVSNSK